MVENSQVRNASPPPKGKSMKTIFKRATASRWKFLEARNFCNFSQHTNSLVGVITFCDPEMAMKGQNSRNNRGKGNYSRKLVDDLDFEGALTLLNRTLPNHTYTVMLVTYDDSAPFSSDKIRGIILDPP